MPARPSNHTASKQPRWIGPHFTSKQNAQDVVRSAIERESSYESSDSEIELDAASDSEVSSVVRFPSLSTSSSPARVPNQPVSVPEPITERRLNPRACVQDEALRHH